MDFKCTIHTKSSNYTRPVAIRVILVLKIVKANIRTCKWHRPQTHTHHMRNGLNTKHVVLFVKWPYGICRVCKIFGSGRIWVRTGQSEAGCRFNMFHTNELGWIVASWVAFSTFHTMPTRTKTTVTDTSLVS